MSTKTQSRFSILGALTLILCIALAPMPALLSSCAAPSSRVQEVKTLKAVGLAVDGTMKVAAQMLHNGQLSPATWQKLAQIHDEQFRPAYNLAVSAVQTNLDSFASPDLVNLASQLSAILAPYLNER